MKNRYIDLIQQSYDFPQEGFEIIDDCLHFHGINLMQIIEQYGTPLKITYLPKISSQIQKAKRLFNVAIAKAEYKGTYSYCYCTKSSHFSFVAVTNNKCIFVYLLILIEVFNNRDVKCGRSFEMNIVF